MYRPGVGTPRMLTYSMSNVTSLWLAPALILRTLHVFLPGTWLLPPAYCLPAPAHNGSPEEVVPHLHTGPSYVMLNGEFSTSARQQQHAHAAECSAAPSPGGCDPCPERTPLGACAARPAQQPANSTAAGQCETAQPDAAGSESVCEVYTDAETKSDAASQCGRNAPNSYASFESEKGGKASTDIMDKSVEQIKPDSQMSKPEYRSMCTAQVPSATNCGSDSDDSSSSVSFFPAKVCTGAKAGLVFKLGHMGLGYYPDTLSAKLAAASKAGAAALAENAYDSPQNSVRYPAKVAATVTVPDMGKAADHAAIPDMKENGVKEETTSWTLEAAGKEAEASSERLGSGQKGDAQAAESKSDSGGHYWGQALQYLDRSIQVPPKARL